MRFLGALCLVVAACGGSTAPAAKQPAPARPVQPPPPITITCADAGVILGGPYAGDPEQERMDFDRDKAIADACTADRWPAAVLECIGSTPQPTECLDQLPETARTAFDEIPQRSGSGDWATPAHPELACEDAVGHTSKYEPVVDDSTPELDWVVRERHKVVIHECDHGWSAGLKVCLQAASPDSDAMKQCLNEHLTPDVVSELSDELTAINKLGAAIAAAKKKPASIGCKQAVAAHYGDAKWHGKVTGFDAKERKRMISESRARMTKACTADKWDATLRACIVAGGDETCFESQQMALSWGYPAAGTVKSMGIAECDAYRAAIQKILTCEKMEASTRDALSRSFEQMQAHMAGMPASQRATLATSCKAGAESLGQVAAAEGC